MSRDEGFGTADIDTGKYADPKLRALWRHLMDPAGMALAVVIHDATILASWAAGERISAEDAAPLWVADPEPAIAALVAVGLLDKAHKVPAKAWESWFAPAHHRREEARLRGQIGGLMSSLGLTRAEAMDEVRARRVRKPPLSGTQVALNPSVPTVPTVPTVLPSTTNGRDHTTVNGRVDSTVTRDVRPSKKRERMEPTPLSDLIPRALPPFEEVVKL